MAWSAQAATSASATSTAIRCGVLDSGFVEGGGDLSGEPDLVLSPRLDLGQPDGLGERGGPCLVLVVRVELRRHPLGLEPQRVVLPGLGLGLEPLGPLALGALLDVEALGLAALVLRPYRLQVGDRGELVLDRQASGAAALGLGGRVGGGQLGGSGGTDALAAQVVLGRRLGLVGLGVLLARLAGRLLERVVVGLLRAEQVGQRRGDAGDRLPEGVVARVVRVDELRLDLVGDRDRALRQVVGDQRGGVDLLGDDQLRPSVRDRRDELGQLAQVAVGRRTSGGPLARRRCLGLGDLRLDDGSTTRSTTSGSTTSASTTSASGSALGTRRRPGR